jgi:hypothetical protein
MTRTDEIHAHALGIELRACPECEATRAMESLHRVQAARLAEELAHGCDFEAELFADLKRMEALKEHWKLIAFAGWALAAMMLTGSLIGTGWK